MNLRRPVTLKSKWFRHFVLSLLSALLFSIAWWGGTAISLFAAFVPLLIIAEKSTKKEFFLWTSLTILVWTVATTYWIANATILGVIGASIVSIVLFSIPFFLYKIVLNRAPKALLYTIFVAAWIACEYLYLYNEQISHPWLILGNGFANSVKVIQWYEYTGAFGGSLWVLIVNAFLYESICRKSRQMALVTATLVAIPMVISVVLYSTYKEEHNPIRVTVVQPNIDPYEDKFEGMSQMEQDQLIQSLAKEAPSNVDYIVAPETAINDNINIENPLGSRSILSYVDFMRMNYPNSEMIIGATMYKFYPHTDEAPTLTARNQGDYYYDAINGSMQIDGQGVESYIKSRLVLGVEMVPFPQLFRDFKVDLGGLSGALITQPDRKVFVNNKEVNVAAAICYESIYGDFITGFVRKGAQAIFVITNDGWWGDTFGYKQHYSYSRLRAIENRRSIARSANTGISGFINQRGDDIKTLGWDVRGTITEEINLNSKLTVYSVYGDVIGRMCSYIVILSLLYFVAYLYKKKSNLN